MREERKDGRTRGWRAWLGLLKGVRKKREQARRPAEPVTIVKVSGKKGTGTASYRASPIFPRGAFGVQGCVRLVCGFMGDFRAGLWAAGERLVCRNGWCAREFAPHKQYI